jgi:hypothetical protein
MRKKIVWMMTLTVALGFGWMILAAAPQETVKSRAYVGHENDRDIQNFIRQYPRAAGTRLDDCQTCHRSGISGTDTEREFSPCGYCHLTQYPNPRYKTGVPKNFEETLNSFGMAYKRNGRTAEALVAVSKTDSDGDGFANAEEISSLRYPGDAASRPGQPLAPTITLNWNKIQKLSRQTQFMLMNTTSEPFDDYTSYTGVLVKDLLASAGVDIRGAAGITVFAPDGYSIDYAVDTVLKPFPKGYFYAAPGNIKDKERAFVRYPEAIPPGIADGREIPGIPWLLLAFERDGKPLETSRYEKGTGRLAGEGPYRLVKPQFDLTGDPSKPGRPDRSIRSKVFGDEWDFNKAIDHSAGACVRGATVIRVNPMPAGFEEYDWKNGWPLVDARQIVIFGKGVKKK